MHNTDSIYERLEQVFQNVFNDETIQLTPETTAEDLEGWDSIKHITLMVSIEQAFGVQFTSDELNSFQDVGDLADRLKKKDLQD